MKKLSLLVPDLGPSELSWSLVRSVNDLVRSRPDVAVTFFVERPGPPCLEPLCPVMPVVEAYSHGGIFVATTLGTAALLERLLGPKERYFLVWDLEWLRQPRFAWSELSRLYRSPALTLLARCPEHCRLLEQCWNTRVARVLPTADLSLLMEPVT